MITKIIVTGDVRRPLGQSSNIKTLFHLIKAPLNLILKDHVDIIWDYQIRDLLSPEDWARLFNEESGYYSNLGEFNSSVLVIGFEIPPVAIRELVGCGCKVIDIVLSPIRFLSDLCWNFKFYGFDCNLTSWAISDAQIKYEAEIVKAAAVKMMGIECPRSTVLLIGQTLKDRSVIENGKFLSLLDFTPQITELSQSHHTIFKPHPHEKLFLDYQSVEGINIYKLLSEPNIETVVAVSSSVLEEASYFGKQSLALKEIKGYEKKNHISTENLINPHFWEHILCRVIKTKRPAPIKINCPRNLARKIFNAYWGMDFL